MARRCKRAGNKVIFATELDAKIALAQRVWKDKGEKRHYPCRGHFHLTSRELNGPEEEPWLESKRAS